MRIIQGDTDIEGEVTDDKYGGLHPYPALWKRVLRFLSFGLIRLPSVIRGEIHGDFATLWISNKDNVKFYGPITAGKSGPAVYLDGGVFTLLGTVSHN